MTGYKELTIDSDLHKKIIDCWEEDKNQLFDNNRFIDGRFDVYQDLAMINPGHALFDLIKLPVPYASLFYLRNPPRSGVGPVHIDGNNIRTCVLNIPIYVNLDESFFFVIKDGETATERVGKPGEIVNNGGKRYEYEPKKYDYHNLKDPCILNSKIPHGFANFADTERVILSICFDKTFEFVKSKLTHI
jgi:hypothetical protein